MKKKNTTKKALVSSLLALTLSSSMLVGTTFAWFTDTATSTGNVIQTGNLNVGMYWAEGSKAVPADDSTDWKDAEKGAIFDYKNWEPGYAQARHLRIANEGSLALKYQLRILANGIVSELARVIDVYYFDTAVQLNQNSLTEDKKLGTLSDVLNNTNANAISRKVSGNLDANEDKEITLVFKMQETAGNEYQNLSIGSDFSVQLLATQYTAEEGSTGNKYDEGADFAPQEKPSAMVSKLVGEELEIGETGGFGSIQPVANFDGTLDTGYQFEPTETYEQVMNSKYANWHADFVVSADSDVVANSLMLAGYYSAFCDTVVGGKWIGFVVPETTAGEEYRLLGGLVAYKDIGEYGNDGVGFRCGVADLYGSNAGVTLTVELRLYETDENGQEVGADKYITIGTFTYTFAGEKFGAENVWVANASELQSALDNAVDGTVINFGADITGDVTVMQKKDVDVTINGQDRKYDGTMTINGDGGSKNTETLTIKNVNFVASEDKDFIYAPSKINNKYNYSHNVTINDCTFTATGAGVHTAGSIVFTGMYNIKVANCTATNMHSLLQAQSCDNTVTVENVTLENCKNGISFGNTAKATIKNATIESVAEGGYGLRFDGEASRGNTTIENVTVKAWVPVLIRRMTTSPYAMSFVGENTLTATNANKYQVAVSGAKDWDGTQDLVIPTVDYTLNGAENFKVFGKTTTVSSAEELTSIISAGGSVTLTEDLNLNETQMTIPAGADVTLNLNGHDLTGSYTGADHYALFTIVDGASLKVEGEGEVTANTEVTDNNRSLAIFQNSGKLTLNGGTYNMNNVRNGKTWIIATIVDNRTSSASCDTVLTINGGDYSVSGDAINLFRNYPQQGGTATIKFNNGTFHGKDNGKLAYIWNQEAGTHLGELYFNGGIYDANVVYEDYNGQSDIHIADGVIIQGYSGNN